MTAHDVWQPKVHGERPRSRMFRISRERAQRMRLITADLNNGFTIAQIGERMGLSPQAVSRQLRIAGVQVAGTGHGNVCLMVSARRVTLSGLDRLCARWRCSRAEAAGRILAACLRKDGETAERVVKEARQQVKKRRAP